MITKEKYGLTSHIAKFDTEQKCHDYLMQVRWNGRPQCPKCGNNHMNYFLTSRNIYKCSQCSKQFSITQGTIFHMSKVPLTKWFLAIYLFTTAKRGISSIQFGKLLGVQQRTAWYILQRLREALKEENDVILSGIIEADETFIAPKLNRDKRLQAAKWKHDKEQIRLNGYSQAQRDRLGIKMKRGRKKGDTNAVLEQRKLENDGKGVYRKTSHIPFEKGTVVFGMIERGGRLFMKKIGTNIKKVTAASVIPLLRNHISSGSTVITDEHRAYQSVNKFFTHQTVNHRSKYVVDDIHTNTIENAWKHLKKMIDGTYFHISYHHSDGYINENTYRWNRREESEKAIFEDFFPVTIGKKLVYKELKKRKEVDLAA